MTTIVDAWQQDHMNFSKLLDMLEGEIRLFHAAAAPDYELMLDIMYYMTHYPDVYHHPKEDLVFGKIASLDLQARDAVQNLLEQHVVLKQSGTQLYEELQGVVDGAMRPRGSVEKPAETYIRYFRDHMNNEESTILPLVRKLLTPADLAAIEEIAPSRSDPLFGADTIGKRYEQLHRRIVASSRH